MPIHAASLGSEIETQIEGAVILTTVNHFQHLVGVPFGLDDLHVPLAEAEVIAIIVHKLHDDENFVGAGALLALLDQLAFAIVGHTSGRGGSFGNSLFRRGVGYIGIHCLTFLSSG